MNTLPLPENELQRLNALQNYQILDTLIEGDYDRITELASLIWDVPISLVLLIDENRQWFKSKLGLDVAETPGELAFCQYAILNNCIFKVEDATLNARFKENILVTAEPNIRFYAGCPLIDQNGFALGTLCIIDRKPKALTESQKRALQLLAEEVTSLIVKKGQREELRNFESLFELSNDLLFVGGIDGFFKKVNPAFEKALGWEKEFLLSTTSLDFIHPDDVDCTFKELRKLSEGHNSVNFVQRFKSKSNGYRSIQWTSAPEPLTGNIFGIGREYYSTNNTRK